jgi:hypothetical protein
MKKIVGLLILSALLFSFSSCRKGDSNPPGEGSTTGGVGTNTDCANLIVLSKNMNIQRYSDKYTISSAAVSGDYLKVNVTYGGSLPHAFQLIWNDLSMKAMTTLELEQNAAGDMGKALITESKCFNISALRTSDAHGKQTFLLSGYNNSLVYTW